MKLPPFPDLRLIPRGWPKHPFRVFAAVIVFGIAGTQGFPVNAVLAAGGIQLLWDL